MREPIQNLVECTFSLPQAISDSLEDRTNNSINNNISRTLQYDLETMYSILERGIRYAKNIFNRNQICFIINCLQISAPSFMERSTRLTRSVFLEYIKKSARDKKLELDEKWTVDKSVILRKLGQIDDTTAFGILEICRLAWMFRNTDNFNDIVNPFKDLTDIVEPFVFVHSIDFHFPHSLGDKDSYTFFPYDGQYSEVKRMTIENSLLKKYKPQGFKTCKLIWTMNDLESLILILRNMITMQKLINFQDPLEGLTVELSRQNTLLEDAGKNRDLAAELQKEMLRK